MWKIYSYTFIFKTLIPVIIVIPVCYFYVNIYVTSVITSHLWVQHKCQFCRGNWREARHVLDSDAEYSMVNVMASFSSCYGMYKEA